MSRSTLPELDDDHPVLDYVNVTLGDMWIKSTAASSKAGGQHIPFTVTS